MKMIQMKKKNKKHKLRKGGSKNTPLQNKSIKNTKDTMKRRTKIKKKGN